MVFGYDGPAQLLGEEGVWLVGEDPLPLVVGEHHERVQRPLDVQRRVLLLTLKQK